jgi:adenylate cyclase
MQPAEIIPFLNDYAGAAIDAIHDEGGDVLKLMGDGVLAIFNTADMTEARRAALRAEQSFRAKIQTINERRIPDKRPATSAYVGLHVGEVFYGNIGSDDRLDFTVVGPAVNEVSRIASMCRSVDREFLASSEFLAGLDTSGRGYFLSTGRFALRGIEKPQELYTLDPAIRTDSGAASAYQIYLASVLNPKFA